MIVVLEDNIEFYSRRYDLDGSLLDEYVAKAKGGGSKIEELTFEQALSAIKIFGGRSESRTRIRAPLRAALVFHGITLCWWDRDLCVQYTCPRGSKNRYHRICLEDAGKIREGLLKFDYNSGEPRLVSAA